MAVYTEAINLISISEEDTINEYYTFNLLMENFDIEVVNEGVSLKSAFEKIKVIWKRFKEWVKKLIKLFREKIKEFKIKFENWFEDNYTKINKYIRDNDKKDADERVKNKDSKKKIKISYYDTNIKYFGTVSGDYYDISSAATRYKLDIYSKTGVLLKPKDEFNKYKINNIEKFNNNNDIKFSDVAQSIFEKYMRKIEETTKKFKEEKCNIMSELNKRNEEECTYDDSTEEAESLSKEEIMKYLEKIKSASKRGTEHIMKLSDGMNSINKQSDEVAKELQSLEKDLNVEIKKPDIINYFNKEIILLKEAIKYMSNQMASYQEIMKEIFTKNQYNKIQYMKLGNIIEPGKFKTEEQKEEKETTTKTSSSNNSNKNTVYGYLM